MTRPREVSQLTTAKLETARRLLRANLGMITPGSPRTCRSWRTCRPSTPSWPDAPSAWQPGGSQHYDSGMLPARLLPSARRAGIAVCTNPRHARDLTPNGTRADAAAGTTAAPAGDVRGTACPLPPGARALPRRCREEQPQYQENDVIDVRLHAADAIVFLDFSPFRCACRAIRRSPERADFWKWLLLYRRRSRPVLRQAVAEHAGDAELYVLPTPRAVRRFIAKIASGMPDSP